MFHCSYFTEAIIMSMDLMHMSMKGKERQKSCIHIDTMYGMELCGKKRTWGINSHINFES